MIQSLILKRAPIGWSQDDYDVVENGVIVGASSWMQSGRGGAHGCGRAATTATIAGRRTATSRRARLRWRRSQRVGDASDPAREKPRKTCGAEVDKGRNVLGITQDGVILCHGKRAALINIT